VSEVSEKAEAILERAPAGNEDPKALLKVKKVPARTMWYFRAYFKKANASTKARHRHNRSRLTG